MNNKEQLPHYFPSLSEAQQDQLLALEDIYRHWNAMINVVSRKDMDAFFTHHVLHSLAIACFVEIHAGWKVLDVGTGGGFPGIPLAIMFPETEFLLVDSIGKKIKVVQEVVEALKLKNVHAETTRAELVPAGFHLVVSRAVTRMAAFYPWVKNKVSFNGLNQGIVFLKGGDLQEEISDFKKLAPMRAVKEYLIQSCLPAPFFETKKVLTVF
ncbi:MAG: 16S rRNA (guanine(527)-N(7))-methyltransferase RsmG [Bacteroidetes bacterium]|nr:16S rRNA (guanine(527)-N(7))-methyltransferase RsmG [Bacteroidota bacterium]